MFKIVLKPDSLYSINGTPQKVYGESNLKMGYEKIRREARGEIEFSSMKEELVRHYKKSRTLEFTKLEQFDKNYIKGSINDDWYIFHKDSVEEIKI